MTAEAQDARLAAVTAVYRARAAALDVAGRHDVAMVRALEQYRRACRNLDRLVLAEKVGQALAVPENDR